MRDSHGAKWVSGGWTTDNNIQYLFVCKCNPCSGHSYHHSSSHYWWVWKGSLLHSNHQDCLQENTFSRCYSKQKKQQTCFKVNILFSFNTSRWAIFSFLSHPHDPWPSVSSSPSPTSSSSLPHSALTCVPVDVAVGGAIRPLPAPFRRRVMAPHPQRHPRGDQLHLTWK